MRLVVMTFFLVPYACGSNTTSTSHEKSIKYIYLKKKKRCCNCSNLDALISKRCLHSTLIRVFIVETYKKLRTKTDI